MKKKILTALLCAITLAATVGTVSAKVVSVSGGSWDYGTENIPTWNNWLKQRVWSNYYHASRVHGSTAAGKTVVFSGWINKGRWSYASTNTGVMGIADSSYYSFK